MTKINTHNVQSILDRYDAENDAGKTSWQDAHLADLCLLLAKRLEAAEVRINTLAESMGAAIARRHVADNRIATLSAQVQMLEAAESRIAELSGRVEMLEDIVQDLGGFDADEVANAS